MIPNMVSLEHIYRINLTANFWGDGLELEVNHILLLQIKFEQKHSFLFPY